MEDRKFKSKQLRVNLTKPAHRKNGFIVPVLEENGAFQTGQDLTYGQMTGKEPLSAEQRLKYPFVVNPEVSHKLQNNVMIDMNTPEASTIINLALMSGYIAKCKTEYNSGQHEGYIIDEEFDAEDTVGKFNKLSEAIDIIKNTKREDLPILVTLVSLQHNSPNMEGATTDNKMIAALYTIAQDLPDNIINCSPKFNDAIKDQMFIGYCVKHKLIVKKGNAFTIMENGKELAFMGTTMIKSVAFLESNPSFKDRLYTKLSEVEPFYQMKVNEKVAEGTGAMNVEELKNAIYIAIHGNPLVANSNTDLDKAEQLLKEYFERSGTTADYTALYREFLKVQYGLIIDAIKEKFKNKNRKSLLATCINGALKDHYDKAKGIQDLDELREYIIEISIHLANDEYNSKLEGI